MAHTSSLPPRVSISDLKGTLIPQDDTKVGQTPSHTIAFANKQGSTYLPDFKVTLRTIQDPEKRPNQKLFDRATDNAMSILSSGAFNSVLQQNLNAKKDYLLPKLETLWSKLPEQDRTRFAYNNIVGRRIEQFFDEAMQFLAKCPLAEQEMVSARRAVNLAHTDAYRNRQVEFDRVNTGTYWSYGHDAAFVHVFEKLRDSLSDNDPKRPFLQKQIDFIYTHKYTPDGNVDENNIEQSLHLRMVDADSRHVVSMTHASSGATEAAYVVLQIPDESPRHAGRYAYRDGNKFYFEDTHEEMNSKDVSLLREHFARSVVFRPLQKGEQARANFRYDWNQNRIIELKKIDTGWWGHCDTKALMETLLADMQNSGGVTEFNSKSGKTVELNRSDLLEGLAALLNFENEYVPAYADRNTQNRFFGSYMYAGARFDDNPDDLMITTANGRHHFDIRVSSISAKDNVNKSVSMHRTFSTKLPDEKLETFKENEDIIRVTDGDVNYIDAFKRKFTAKTHGTSFDEKGNAFDLEVPFEIDPTKNSTKRILIGSNVQSVIGRLINRTYYDPSTKELLSVPTRFVNDHGVYKAIEGEATSLGEITGLAIGREMQENDDVAGKLKAVQEAIRSGDKIAVDSDPGPKVWNGEVHTLKLTTEHKSSDGRWERVSVLSDATFGPQRIGTIINELDAEGNIIDSCEVKAGIDFFWQARPQVAPLIFDNGEWFANKSMLERGVLDLGEGKAASIGALQDLYDLVYLGFKTNNHKPVFTIVHDGKRLVYNDEKQWKQDVKHLTKAAKSEAKKNKKRGWFKTRFGS